MTRTREIYEKAIDNLRQGGEGVDADLQAAFRKVAVDLAGASTSDVVLVFTNQALLDEPAGARELLAEQFEAELTPEDKANYAGPTEAGLGAGEAFSSQYDGRRRSTFEAAFRNALEKGLGADLLELTSPQAVGGREGQIVFEVGSTIRRTPEFYTYTSGGVFSGFLFAIVVEWSFKVFARDGELLYESTIVSEPAGEVSIRPTAGAPDWSPYSVMMDSAYYNYAREVIGRFGLAQPEEKTEFSFQQ